MSLIRFGSLQIVWVSVRSDYVEIFLRIPKGSHEISGGGSSTSSDQYSFHSRGDFQSRVKLEVWQITGLRSLAKLPVRLSSIFRPLIRSLRFDMFLKSIPQGSLSRLEDIHDH
jgi:hypothetical protein